MRVLPFNTETIIDPKATPEITANEIALNTLKSTDFLFAWFNADIMEVGTIFANEVPTARCIRTFSSISANVKI